ncbi:MAG: OmpA family protein [Acidisphaera sp.]|nr:OmpA family protein [Acidisphaera sp.]
MHPYASLTAATALLALAAISPGPALAQANPSSSDIINSLRPTGPIVGGTRGIRPVGPGTEPAPSAAPAITAPAPRAPASRHAPATAAAAQPIAPPPAGGSAPSVNLTVQFANGSDQLTPGAMHTLDELGRALSSQDLASYRFRIEGHTDTVGRADSNKTLSEQRAEKVVDYLAAKFNIDRSRLQAIGMGEEGLLVQTGPNVPEPRNRRVQVVNLGA